MARLTGLVLAALALASGVLCLVEADKQFKVVTDLANETPDNVSVKVLGEMQEAFNRSAPNVMDSNLLEDFHREFSFMQDISSDASDPNTFEATSLTRVPW